MSTRQKFFHQLILLTSGVLMAIGVLCGLVIIEAAAKNLLSPEGVDLALPGNQVGELDIISTRDTAVERESVLRIILGGGIIAGSAYAARRAKLLLTPLPDQAHSEQ